MELPATDVDSDALLGLVRDFEVKHPIHLNEKFLPGPTQVKQLQQDYRKYYASIAWDLN